MILPVNLDASLDSRLNNDAGRKRLVGIGGQFVAFAELIQQFRQIAVGRLHECEAPRAFNAVLAARAAALDRDPEPLAYSRVCDA